MMIFDRKLPKNIKPFYIGFLILISILFVGISFIPVSIDYDHYISATRSWLVNETRFYDDHSNSFYYMPWSLIITAPLSILPDRWGQATLNLLSILGITLSLRFISKNAPWWGTLFVFANLFTFNLLFSAQWDGLVLGAISLGWWSIEEKKPLGVGIALTIMSTKPTNVFLVILMIVVYLLTKWDKVLLIRTAIIPLIAGISSFVISGIDWPMRYLQFLSVNPPPDMYNLTVWHQDNSIITIGIISALILIMVAWIVAKNHWDHFLGNGEAIIFTLLINILLSNYVLSYHYIYTIPALGWLSKKRWFFALIVFGLMVSYVFGLANVIAAPPYFVYPLSIFVLCLAVLFEESCKEHIQLEN